MRLLTLTPALLIVLAVPSAARGEDRDHARGHHAEELGEIIVQATRSRRRVQDEPMRVEVLSRETITENLLTRTARNRAVQCFTSRQLKSLF